MRWVVVLCVASGCGGSQRPILSEAEDSDESKTVRDARDPAREVQPSGGAAAAPAAPTPTSLPAADLTRCTDQQDQRAAADVAAIREGLRSDSAAALVRLGLTVDEFDHIAKALYFKWREIHPEPTPPAGPRLTAPVVAAPRARPSEDDRRWWCFISWREDWGDCGVTHADCDERRARYVNRDGTTPCNGLPAQECIDIAAGIRAIGACERQPRASCFQKHYVLADSDEDACAPTISFCKSRRALAARAMTDDIKIKSACTARD